MYCLNHRIGILFRQNLAKKSYELRYFFIDDEANLFYIANLPKLQKVIRLCKELKQIKIRLIKTGQKSFNLNSYNISIPKPYTTESVLPFGNRTCIEMKEKQQKQAKQTKQQKQANNKNNQKVQEKTGYMILGLMDEDTAAIYEEILHLTGKKKKQPIKRKSIQDKIQEYAEQKVFDSYLECSVNFSMNGDKSADNQYDGELTEGKAQGKGKQILVSKGVTYNGVFSQGKKHGRGYLVNKNLDTMECQFIDDELSGI